MIPDGQRAATGGMRAHRDETRRARAVPILCFVAALALYLPRLGVPPTYSFDETYHAYTASRYLAGDHDAYLWSTRAPDSASAYTWNHPPAGLWLIAGGVALWGDRPFGWRFASAVFGAVGVVLAYFLALRLTGERAAAELTTALLLLEGLWFVQSRTGMLDIFGAVFMMGALVAFHGYLAGTPAAGFRRLLVTGVCLGLAIATKWNAAYPSLAIGLVALGGAASGHRGGNRGWAAGTVLVALALLPATVYLATYLPFFAAGHTPEQFVHLQRQIYEYHTTLRAAHTDQSRWWEWPLLLRPVWYHVTYGPNTVANVYAQGNPPLAWLFVPAALWLARRWWRERRAAFVTLAIGFFGQWLPWALVPRPGFLYYFLPAVPFGVLAVASAVAELWTGRPVARAVALGYVALVAAAFVFFHPVYAAVPLTPEAFSSRVWLPGWR